MKTLFDICIPRADVLSGTLKDESFAADLAQVLTGKAPAEYGDPALFFAHTHPTDGLRRVLDSVCRRLSGTEGDIGSVFRLDTQFGGGKTHTLIALLHAVRGMQGVSNVAEFIDPNLLPQGTVRVAAFDGENADPANGRKMGDGVKAFTPWGELAYALGGSEGYQTVQASDTSRTAPGADTLEALFGGQPTLILLDELGVYLRKVHGKPDASQLVPFLTSLIKAVERTDRVVLVFTLALGKEGGVLSSSDAYSHENQEIAFALDKAISELSSASARKATILNPTNDSETVLILRRRLFDGDLTQRDADIQAVVSQYQALFDTHKADLPQQPLNWDDLRRGYPFHPALIDAFKNKLSTLDKFQRVRGMLRLLTRAIIQLWQQRPPHTYALHLHHLDLGNERIHNDVVTRLQQEAFAPAIRHDIARADASHNDPTAPKPLAQTLDQDFSSVPYASFVARTIFWNSLAFNKALCGLSTEALRASILAPSLDLAFINQATNRFRDQSFFLDDSPGSPLRIHTQANVNQMIRRRADLVKDDRIRELLDQRIRKIFDPGPFQLVRFPASPQDIPDDSSTSPYLALLSYDALSLPADAPPDVPALIATLFSNKNDQGSFRDRRNNLIFLVASYPELPPMRDAAQYLLAIRDLHASDDFKALQKHQQDDLKSRDEKAEHALSIRVQSAYRHLFWPARRPAEPFLSHQTLDKPSTAAKPGDGQAAIASALRAAKKVLDKGDAPPNPAAIRDDTSLKHKGYITLSDLRERFLQDFRLPILLRAKDKDDLFLSLIHQGIENGVWVYRRFDTPPIGKGEPPPSIVVDGQSFLYTCAYAVEQGVWPHVGDLLTPKLFTSPWSGGKTSTQALWNALKNTPLFQGVISEAAFEKLLLRGVQEGHWIYRYNDTLLGKGDAPAPVMISDNATLLTLPQAKKEHLWPRQALPADGLPAHTAATFAQRPPSSTKTPRPAGPAEVSTQQEAAFGQALTQAVEHLRAQGGRYLLSMNLTFFVWSEALTVCAASPSLNAPTKHIQLTASYTTKQGATFSAEFSAEVTTAFANDFKPLRTFLDAQLKAAADKKASTTLSLTFKDQDLSNAWLEAFKAALAPFASGNTAILATASTSTSPPAAETLTL